MGSDSTGVATKFEDEWNSGNDFDCETGSPILSVWAVTGQCDWYGVTLTFEVLSPGGIIQNQHAFEYEIACVGENDLSHRVGFDAQCSISGDPCFVPTEPGGEQGDCLPGTGECVVQELVNIDEGIFNFPLAGGDAIRITTTEEYFGGEPPTFSGATQPQDAVPTLGEWGAIIVGAAIALAAIVLILRRREV